MMWEGEREMCFRYVVLRWCCSVLERSSGVSFMFYCFQKHLSHSSGKQAIFKNLGSRQDCPDASNSSRWTKYYLNSQNRKPTITKHQTEERRPIRMNSRKRQPWSNGRFAGTQWADIPRIQRIHTSNLGLTSGQSVTFLNCIRTS